MIKKIFFFLVMTFNICFCFSQISGICKDTLGNPIPYANIGLKNSTLGTVTNSEGRFIIDDKSLTENNCIIISHIGYETKSVIVPQKAEIKIIMQELKYNLAEVVIIDSRYLFTKEKRIGNNMLTDKVVVSFSSRNLGTEGASFFEVPKGRKYKIEKVHFNIAELGYEKGTFRINFYNSNNDGDIEMIRYNSRDIITEVSSKGDVNIDVKSENLVFEKGFLVSIEWIDFVEKKPAIPDEQKIIHFSSNVFCGPYYYRSNNLTKWNQYKLKYNMCLGMQLLVQY